MFEHVTQKFATITKDLWNKYSKNEEYNRDLATYQIFRRRIDQMKYKKLVRIAKRVFFNNRIQEITSTNKRL